jgi:hypothetical protein
MSDSSVGKLFFICVSNDIIRLSRRVITCCNVIGLDAGIPERGVVILLEEPGLFIGCWLIRFGGIIFCPIEGLDAFIFTPRRFLADANAELMYVLYYDDS